jgi:hypothetical protein
MATALATADPITWELLPLTKTPTEERKAEKEKTLDATPDIIKSLNEWRHRKNKSKKQPPCPVCLEVPKDTDIAEKVCEEKCQGVCKPCLKNYIKMNIKDLHYGTRALKCPEGCGSFIPTKKWVPFADNEDVSAFTKLAQNQLTLQCGNCHTRGSVFYSSEVVTPLAPQFASLEPSLKAFKSYQLTAFEFSKEITDFWEKMRVQKLGPAVEKADKLKKELESAEKNMEQFKLCHKDKHDEIGCLSRRVASLQQAKISADRESRDISITIDRLRRKEQEQKRLAQKIRSGLHSKQEKKVKELQRQCAEHLRKQSSSRTSELSALRRQMLHAAIHQGATAASKFRAQIDAIERTDAKLQNLQAELKYEETALLKTHDDVPLESIQHVRIIMLMEECKNTQEEMKALESNEAQQALLKRAKDLNEEYNEKQMELARKKTSYDELIAIHQNLLGLKKLRQDLTSIQTKLDTFCPHENLVMHLIRAVLDTERRATLMLRLCNMFPFVKSLCCAKYHCFRCKTNGKHPGISCENNVNRPEMRDIRMCPTCNIYISKGDGCSSITCICGSNFSWQSAALVNSEG